MTAVAGALVAVRIETIVTGTYIALGGLRSREISISNEPIDITSSDSTDRWKELLLTLGGKTVEISGEGVFRDGASQDRLNTVVMSTTPVVKMQFFIPLYGTFEGNFFVSNVSFSSDHTDAAMFSATFTSSGAVTYTAPA